MTGKTHAAIGANVVWLVKFTTLPIHPLLVGVGALAALLPDLDASESTIKHVSIRLAGIRVQPFYLPAVFFSSIFKHRGWLHSAVAILVVGILSWIGFASYDRAISLVITLAYASHLIADACTVSGIHFWLPIPQEFHLLPKPLRIRTGGTIEQFVFLIAAGAVVFFLLSENR